MKIFRWFQRLFQKKMTIDEVIEFCKWSKIAEWRTGTKQIFMSNDWNKYIQEFQKSQKK